MMLNRIFSISKTNILIGSFIVLITAIIIYGFLV